MSPGNKEDRLSPIAPLESAPAALAPLARKVNELVMAVNRLAMIEGVSPVSIVSGDDRTNVSIDPIALQSLIMSVMGGAGAPGAAGAGGAIGPGGAAGLGPPTNTSGDVFTGGTPNLTLGLRALNICENGTTKTILVVGTISF